MLASHRGQWWDGADLGCANHDSFIRQDCSGKQTVGDRIKHWSGASCGSGRRGRKCLAEWAVGQGNGSYSGGEWT